MKDELYEIRRNNLRLLLRERYEGRKAALADDAQIPRNHLNLLVTHNATHQRNMGDMLARRSEVNLNLPALWLDWPHSTDTERGPDTIRGGAVDIALRDVLRPCEIPAYYVPEGWVETLPHCTGRENIYIAAVVTDGLAPDVQPGAWVVVDGGAKAIHGDGYYVLERGGTHFLRHVKNMVDGTLRTTGGAKVEPETLPVVRSQPKGLHVVGRLLAQLPHPMILR